MENIADNFIGKGWITKIVICAILNGREDGAIIVNKSLKRSTDVRQRDALSFIGEVTNVSAGAYDLLICMAAIVEKRTTYFVPKTGLQLLNA